MRARILRVEPLMTSSLVGVGGEIALPLRITIVSALGGHEDHPRVVMDRAGEHGRARLARFAPIVRNSTGAMPRRVRGNLPTVPQACLNAHHSWS